MSAASIHRESLSSSSEDAALDCLEADRRNWRQQGFSLKVIQTALAATRDSSRNVYDQRWGAYRAWCKTRGYNPVSLPVVSMLEFLQWKAKICARSTIRRYVMAISHYYKWVAVGTTIVKTHSLVSASSGRRRMSGRNMTSLFLALFHPLTPLA